MVGESFFCPTASSDLYMTPEPNTINNSWNQVPPVYMPWTSLPENQVTRFSGETSLEHLVREPPDLRITPWIPPENGWDISKTSKRKCDDISDSLFLKEPVRKQLITEEKIAAHMSRLHISGTTCKDQLLPETNNSEIPLPLSQPKENSEDILEKFKLKNSSKLVLSEEFRQLRQETCLPPSLLEQLTRPTMAVVLWQPPGSAVSSIISAVLNGSRNASEALAPAQPPPPQPEPAPEEDSNNNEPMDNLNWNMNEAPGRPPDVDMDDQDL